MTKVYIIVRGGVVESAFSNVDAIDIEQTQAVKLQRVKTITPDGWVPVL